LGAIFSITTFEAALVRVSACNCIKLNIYYSGFIIINSKKYFNFAVRKQET
jgi:hypothetical protein